MKNLSSCNYLLLFILFCSCYLPGLSQADYIATSGDWNSGGTWGGSTPTSGTAMNPTVIQIPAGESVNIGGGTDITLDNAILVIQGELVVGNSGFNYSSLTLNGSGSGVVVEPDATITDSSIFGLFNFIQVDGVNFWGGQYYSGGGGTPTYQNDFTPTSEVSEPLSLENPLPVVLVSFTVDEDNGAVVLKWITASEIDNEVFEIHRSFDGNYFERIGFVKGHGTTSDPHEYSYQDAISTDAYYRLKQIDFDGQFEYSPIRLATVSKPITQKLSLYPNPTYGPITIDGVITNYALFDPLGNLLLENHSTTSFSAQSDISRYLTQQKSGTYLFKTVIDGKMRGIRIIKQ